jgi:ubiquinone/menaquinone biosynthesis C-methylase UbiE
MKPLYQTEWQNIPFSSFTKLSSKTLPGPKFYNAFYRAVIEKYQNYEALDADWRRNKSDLADWLAEQFHEGARVLSVGCGLGYMESRLWQLHGDRMDLYVQDYATDAHLWLKQVMPEDHIHVAGGGGRIVL